MIGEESRTNTILHITGDVSTRLELRTLDTFTLEYTDLPETSI